MDTERKIMDGQAAPAECFAGRCIHLIGMGGSGMRALAQMLIDHGAVVSGSDMHPSAALDRSRHVLLVFTTDQRQDN